MRVHLQDVRYSFTVFYLVFTTHIYDRGCQNIRAIQSSSYWYDTSRVYYKILRSDHLIGAVTSGIPSPTLSKNIAMGYVKSGFHKKGTEVEVDVRNKLRNAVLTPMPFLKPKYWRG